MEGCVCIAILAGLVVDIATAHEHAINGFAGISAGGGNVVEFGGGGMGRKGGEEGMEVGFVGASGREGFVA